MKRILCAASLGALAMAAAGCKRAADTATIVASGHVEATDVRISTKVPGRLDSFTLQEGDVIALGQPLGRIDTTDARISIQQAKADRDQASAELRLRVAGARREDIAEIEAQVAADASDLDGAQKDLDRMQGLLDKGSGTTKARDDAKVRRDSTAHRLEATRQSLARMKAGSRAEEIEAARARVASMEARIAQLEQQIQDASVVSPVSGVVTEKIADQGELLQAGSALCVITDLSDAWLTVYVSETDLGRIRIGQEAEVRTDEKVPQVRKGKVTFIASKAEFTPKNVQTRDERVKLVFRVKVGLDNKDGLFKPGMPSEARLQAAAAVQ